MQEIYRIPPKRQNSVNCSLPTSADLHGFAHSRLAIFSSIILARILVRGGRQAEFTQKHLTYIPVGAIIIFTNNKNISKEEITMKKLRWLIISVLVLSLLFTTFAGCDSKASSDNAEVEEDTTETGNTATQDPTTALSSCKHKWDDWTESETPVCAAGYKTRTCSKCEETEQVFIAPLDHKLIAIEIEYADEDDIKARFSCEYCGMLLLKTVEADADDDEDGIVNSMEISIGTNPFDADTDKDGLDDKREVSDTNTDPVLADSDKDGLSDLEEIDVYHTKPLVADTDNDGVTDGKEVEMGFEPLVSESTFLVSYTPTFEDDDNMAVTPSLEAELTPELVNSLTIKRSNVVSHESVGYMGDAFDFSVDKDIVADAPVSLTIGFEFDESSISKDAQPTIYAIEENEHGIKHMVPVETEIVDCKATALVDKFTTYVLVDRTQLEEDLTWIDTYNIDKNFDKLEIVFVIDDSGSMTSYDPYNQRLDVARELIEKLPTDTKIGIVAFGDTSEYRRLTGDTLITDKSVAQNYLTTSYYTSNGWSTYMYDAISRSFELFESTDENTMRMMVVLTDGISEDTSYHSSVISTAVLNNVNLFTVGLGSGNSNYFERYLKPLASGTDGEFYLSDDASNLAEAFNAIGEKLSLTVDSDKDGLSDYYEENTVLFSGVEYVLDKHNPDTDDDGLLDGEEIVTTIIYSVDGTKMSVTGVVKSNPSMADSDGDGVNDKFDVYPMDNTK